MTGDINYKLEVLRASSSDNEFDQLLGKLLEATLSQNQRRLREYDRDLQRFEQQFEMTSALFYRRFEAGELGDKMDFFEWAGLYELHQEIQSKVLQLEQMV